MRFFKAFSLLHRRTKSDSDVVQVAPRAHVRPVSFPVDQPGELVLTDNTVFDTFVPLKAHTPTTADRSSLITLDNRIRSLESANAVLKSTNKTPAALCDRIHVLESEIIELKRRSLPVALTTRIDELELEKRQLNSTIQVLLTTVTELSDDANKTRCDLHDMRVLGVHLRRQAKVDEEEIERLETKLNQYVKFVGMMVDIGLHDAVLDRACTALKAGEDADEALIDAIKEAATKPGSPWSRIVPAVTGPRTSEEYLSAIGMTLKLRRELKDSKKVSKFWKHAAKETLEHADTFTPSVSNISSIREQLTEERQTAVDDLLAKLRSGAYPRRRTRPIDVTSETRPSLVETATVDDSEVVRSSLTFSSTSDLTSAIRVESVVTCDFKTPPHDSSSTIRGPYVPNLAPLASESFKKELSTSHVYKRVSTSSKRLSRTILGEVDMNRNVKSSLPASNSAASQGSRRSAKTLEKRHAMMVTESIESIQAAYAPRRASVHAAPLPVVDPFAAALSKSLLAINQERQQRPDPRRMSNGNTAFDNSAFSRLADNVTYDPYAEAYSSGLNLLGNISMRSETTETETDDTPSRSLSRIIEESRCCSPPTPNIATAGANLSVSDVSPIHKRPNDSGNDTDHDFSFINETMSPGGTTIMSTPGVSPLKTAEVITPVKKSKLPVMKHFRRLSVSPVSAQAGKFSKKIAPTTPTVTTVTNNSASNNRQPISRPLPVKPSHDKSTSPSRLPTFAAGPANGRLAESGKRAVRRISQIIS